MNILLCFLITAPAQVEKVDLVSISCVQPALWAFWLAPSSERPIQNYEIEYRSLNRSTDWNRVLPNPTSTSVTIGNLQSGQTYQVRVRAVSDVGCGVWSKPVLQSTINGKLLVVYIGWISSSCGLTVYIETVKAFLIDFNTSF